VKKSLELGFKFCGKISIIHAADHTVYFRLIRELIYLNSPYVSISKSDAV
jgi:hypothetical protein